MFKIKFKTLIPNAVKNWIFEKGFEEPLVEAEKRLGWRLGVVEEFKINGTIFDIEYDEFKQMVGNCSIVVEAETEEEAKKKFSKMFQDTVKKGQRFKFESFTKIT